MLLAPWRPALFQFLRSFLEIPVNSPPDQLCHWRSRFLVERLQLLHLVGPEVDIRSLLHGSSIHHIVFIGNQNHESLMTNPTCPAIALIAHNPGMRGSDLVSFLRFSSAFDNEGTCKSATY